MDGDNPRSRAQIGGHPIHPLLIPFPIVAFIGVMVTDIMWLTTREGGWATAGNWLLGVGLVTALGAAAAGMADYLGDDRIKKIGAATRHMIANIVVVTLEAVNLVARVAGSTDQIGAIGMWLSTASVAILIYSGWLGGELVYKYRVGVHDRGGDSDADVAQPPLPDRKFSRDRR